MSPKKRARVIEAIREMYEQIRAARFDRYPGDTSFGDSMSATCELEARTEAELTALLLSLEALLERTQETDI